MSEFITFLQEDNKISLCSEDLSSKFHDPSLNGRVFSHPQKDRKYEGAEVSNGMMLILSLLERAFRTLKLGANMPKCLARLLTRSACTRRGSSNVGVSIQEVRHHLTLPLHLYGTPTGERVAFGVKDLVHLLCNLQTNSLL